MCGICGFVADKSKQGKISYEKTQSTLIKMTDTLSHRGPDDAGHWSDMEKGVALGHRRLSIIDLSEKGRQPMVSASERYVITLNGETYNYLELAEELDSKGVKFKSSSDTEVLLELIDFYGVDQALEKAEGMFGLAVYDRKENCLYLARDRIGEKPVYYGWNNGYFVFASELKAIKSLEFFKPIIEEQAVYLFLKYFYIKSPLSIYKGIYKLLPGHIYKLNLNTKVEETYKYWDLEEVAVQGAKNQFQGTLEEATDVLDELLTSIISRQMRSDVPLGLFLSSGVDSSTVAALAQKQSANRIKAFTIGSDHETINEAKEAQRIARHLNLDYNEFYVTERDYVDLLTEMTEVFDEPFACPYSIPGYIVAQKAREHMTVSLAGDGGDELFAGYHRMYRYMQPWEDMVSTGKSKNFDDYYDYYRYNSYRNYGFYDSMLKIPPVNESFFKQFTTDKLTNYLDRSLYHETLIFPESNVLVKVDRTSMAHSLEVREPFFSHKAVEFAWSLPPDYKCDVRNKRTKIILRNLLSRYVPKEIAELPKKGFHTPINQWIFSPMFSGLAEWAFDIKNLNRSGYLNAPAVHRIWEDAKVNRQPMSYFFIYTILCFQLWCKKEGLL